MQTFKQFRAADDDCTAGWRSAWDALEAFRDRDHRPFFREAGPAAALLVHGMLGTPAEMRPLADALLAGGWTTQAILLPGFGPDVAKLVDVDYVEWGAAISDAINALLERFCPVMVVAHGFGVHLALPMLAGQPAVGLAALAPLSHLGSARERAVWRLRRPFTRCIDPLRGLPASDPSVRDALHAFAPGANLEDPQVQAAVAGMRAPRRLIDQFERAAWLGRRAAKRFGGPALFVEDTSAGRRRDTLRWLSHFPTLPDYVELAGEGRLLDPHGPAWPELTRALLRFGGHVQRTCQRERRRLPCPPVVAGPEVPATPEPG